MKKIDQYNTLIEINRDDIFIKFDYEVHYALKCENNKFDACINNVFNEMYVFTDLKNGDLVFEAYYFKHSKPIVKCGPRKFPKITSAFFLLKDCFKYYKFQDHYNVWPFIYFVK